MPPVKPTLAALLDVARQLIMQREFDGEVILTLFSRLGDHDLNVQTMGAVKHARLAVLAGCKTSAEIATARFALARVVTLVEQQL